MAKETEGWDLKLRLAGYRQMIGRIRTGKGRQRIDIHERDVDEGAPLAFFLLDFSIRRCWNADPMSKLYRFALLFAIPLLCASCTTYQSLAGENSVVPGHGGIREVVDGIEVWTYGDPPRPYKVLGVIPDERPRGGPYFAQVNPDVVEMARKAGGDAVMYVPSWADLRGVYTSESLKIPISYIVVKYLD